ncbi:MAG: SDR family oxidoreductase [Opitutaceae bacterium]|nr:SDR family oxidoreductase [Cytophagales bacterium]
MTENNNKTVLVTGATSGIGYELAKLFAENGYNIVHVARNGEKMKEIGDDLIMAHNIKVTNIVKDLAEPNAAKEVYEEVRSKGIVVDILVNNVGAGVFGKFSDTDLDEELGTIRLNIDTLVIFTKLFLKDMIARNEGKILQLASMVSKAPTPMQAVYAGTKAFIYIFSQSIINELKGTNVTVTLLRPGATDTDFFREAGAEDIKIHQPDQLADPAKVAKDGFEALMRGDTTVVSGIKNNIQDKLSNLLPDEVIASQMAKMNERVEK